MTTDLQEIVRCTTDQPPPAFWVSVEDAHRLTNELRRLEAIVTDLEAVGSIRLLRDHKGGICWMTHGNGKSGGPCATHREAIREAAEAAKEKPDADQD